MHAHATDLTCADRASISKFFFLRGVATDPGSDVVLYHTSDWGRQNIPQQAAVAASMDYVARNVLGEPMVTISAGDNMQATGGLSGIADPEFDLSYSE